MKKRPAAIDDRQATIPIDLPPGPRLSSDERAGNELVMMVATLASAKSHPWSARLLGWQRKRFEALKQLLTPLDAAPLTTKFNTELERLGPAED